MIGKATLIALAMVAAPSAASAATIVILTDPMTLERRAVVVNKGGPDRVLLCAAPPAVAGCRELPLSRR